MTDAAAVLAGRKNRPRARHQETASATQRAGKGRHPTPRDGSALSDSGGRHRPQPSLVRQPDPAPIRGEGSGRALPAYNFSRIASALETAYSPGFSTLSALTTPFSTSIA